MHTRQTAKMTKFINAYHRPDHREKHNKAVESSKQHSEPRRPCIRERQCDMNEGQKGEEVEGLQEYILN